MIELCGLTKSFRTVHGRHYVFHDLSLTFPDGSNIGLIGPNGAGKSTLMRVIGGIDPPDRGKVVTDKRISFPVGLSGGFQGSLSGRDNAKFVCRLYGSSPQVVRDKVSFVEDFAELGKYFDMPIKTYSSGMRSRLIFGLSMAFDFDYYLMDEVGAVGDAGFREKSSELLETKIGSANVICVSHNMSVIRAQCDRLVLLQGGEAVLYEDVEEGIRAYQGDAYRNPARPPRRRRPVSLETITPGEVKRARRIMRLVRRARRDTAPSEAAGAQVSGEPPAAPPAMGQPVEPAVQGARDKRKRRTRSMASRAKAEAGMLVQSPGISPTDKVRYGTEQATER